jgi:hypothetical protein
MNTGFVVDEAVPGLFILRKLWFSSVTIIPPLFHAQILLICSRGYTIIAFAKLIGHLIDKLIGRQSNHCN